MIISPQSWKRLLQRSYQERCSGTYDTFKAVKVIDGTEGPNKCAVTVHGESTAGTSRGIMRDSIYQTEEVIKKRRVVTHRPGITGSGV